MLFKPSSLQFTDREVNYKGGIKKLLAVALRNRKLFSKVTNFRYLFKQERDTPFSYILSLAIAPARGIGSSTGCAISFEKS